MFALVVGLCAYNFLRAITLDPGTCPKPASDDASEGQTWWGIVGTLIHGFFALAVSAASAARLVLFPHFVPLMVSGINSMALNFLSRAKTCQMEAKK
ncbi:hypothetical protein DFP72DRAFT_934168 [Ephemerocybe angulata]|uniref:Uncharacterized protein n=1 Tax=Ephemerocybe angulata TaxID=980116 RepID=A0A8H6HCE8_9AGAR|nr:hypothetical protein DFP72DRAFT_934168 [Tulosesus angulatus]